MSAPVRIQRRRTKGWRMPEGAVYVGRGSPWGNPFRVGFSTPMHCNSAKEATDLYRSWVTEAGGRKLDLGPLRGKNIACWCALDQPCHADVLLELANRVQP